MSKGAGGADLPAIPTHCRAYGGRQGRAGGGGAVAGANSTTLGVKL